MKFIPLYPEKRIRFSVIMFIVLTLTISLAKAQPDTLYPSGIIKPFDVSDSTIITAPLQHGVAVGDINGDGTCDFIYNNPLHSNGEIIGYSLVVTDIAHPENGAVIDSYQGYIKGIGDFNGDGFDDMLDEHNWYVLFGNTEGDHFDTLYLNGSNSDNELLYHTDLDGDGTSDLVYSNGSVYVLSYNSPTPVLIHIHNGVYFRRDKALFDYYDYDNDGTDELFIAFYDFSETRYDYAWYSFDTASGEYNYELFRYRYVNHEPYESFTMMMSDINGDGLKDICHDYYVSGEGFNLEVYLANPDTPYQYYYDTAVDIPLGVNNRLLYCAGDLNGDGADDWYSKEDVDTLVVFYGNQNVISEGFTKELYPVDNNKLYMPNSRFQQYTLTEQPPLFDYNQDGKNDILMDFWQFDEHGRYQTVADAIITGGDSLDFSSPTLINKDFGNIEPNAMFGSKIRNAGDINHDGYDDWAVVSLNANLLSIYFGGAGELDFTPDITVLLPQYPLAKLYDVAFGDLNNDGWKDIVVSNNSSYDISMAKGLLRGIGRVYVFFGSAGMADTLYAADATKSITNGDNSNTYSPGRSLNIPGDYNADGYNDLVIKSWEPRKALLFFGGEQLSDQADMQITVYTTGYSSSFAIPVTACGDVNNDGYTDFTLGDAPHAAGRSLVYYGGPDADNQYDLAINNSESGGMYFGEHAVDNQGDFNDDGQPDLAIWNINISATQIFLGGTGFDDQPDLILSDSSLGTSTITMEYVNGFSKKDRADLLMSGYLSPNNLYLFYGSDTDKTEADMIFSNTQGRISGIASGDFNKDGFVDVLTGSAGALVDGKITAGVVQHFISPLRTGIDSPNASLTDKVSLYPNPAHDFITVQVKDNSQQVTVTLINNKGSVLMSKKISGTSTRFFTGNLSDGVYLIRVTGNGNSLTKKFIKE